MGICPTGLCPASLYGSTLIQVPTPGTENTTTTLLALGGVISWISRSATTTFFMANDTNGACATRPFNLTNWVALYNFLSTFSGTHYVTPCAMTATISFHF